jgi:chromosome segregation ATPase
MKDRERDDYDAAPTKDRQQLEAKITALSEQVTALNARLTDVQHKSVSEDVLMHTHLRLLNQMHVDHTTLKKKIKTLGTNTAKACRSLDDGLQDVQGTSVELLAYCDKVNEALLATGISVPREVLPEYPSRSRRTSRLKSNLDWDTDDDG